MPKYHSKQKVLGGRAEVLSFERDHETFYFRQYDKPTRSYRSTVIKGVKTLDEAVEAAPDYLLAFSQPRTARRHPSEELSQIAVGRHENINRQRSEPIEKALANFIKQEEIRLKGGLIKTSSLERRERAVRLGILPYLKSKGVNRTSQIGINTFSEYAAFRSSSLRTRISLKGELDVIAFFIRSYLVKNKLIAPEIALSKDLVQRPKIRESDLLANPAFNEDDFQLFIRHIRAWIPRFDPLKPKSYYFRKMFYEWVLVAKNTGARPEELMKLKWRDIEHQDVRRDSETARQENIAHLLQQGVHYSTLSPEEQESLGEVENWITLVTLRSAKTGNLRTVPCNLSKVFDRWRDFQRDWMKQHYPEVEITPNTLVWGQPAQGLKKTYADHYIGTTFTKLRDELRSQFKGHWLSDHPYTRYSLRSTFIEVQLLKKISPIIVAEMAGHDIKMLYEIYQKLNVRQMAKEITAIDRGKRKSTTGTTRTALEDA